MYHYDFVNQDLFNAKTKQIYRSRRTQIEELKKDICKWISYYNSSSNYRLYSSTDEYGDKWEIIDDRPDSILEDIDLTKNALYHIWIQ